MENINRFHRKFFLLGLLTVVALFALYTIFLSGEETQIQTTDLRTTTVQRGDISQTIKVLGEAELVDEQTLRFTQVGTIAAVYFQDGAQVQKDQVIAELDKTEGYNDIRQAEISLENSQLSLQEILKGNDASQILQAQNSVAETKQQIEIAKQDLEIAKQDEQNTITELELELAQSEKDLADKNIALESTKKQLENTELYEEEGIESTTVSYRASIDKALLDVKDAMINADNIRDDLDAILGVEENTKKDNDAYELYLGFRDQNTKTAARNAYVIARNDRKALDTDISAFEAITSPSVDDAVVLLDGAVVMLESIFSAADSTYIMLQQSITNSSLSQSQLDSFKASAAGARGTAQSSLSSFKNQVTTLKNLEEVDLAERRKDDTLTAKQDAVRSAETALTKMQDALTNLRNSFTVKKENKRLERVSKENALTNLESRLRLEAETLKDVQEGESVERIAIARNDVAQKELALERVQKNLEDYELRAPFDGVLRKIDFKVGDNLLADEDKFAYLENPDLLKITILLDQIDIVKIKEGYRTRIVFDALPEQEFWGEIEEIDQTPVEQSGVVSYGATITLHKDDEPIFSGMTTSIEVFISEKADVLLVPSLVITSRNGATYVQQMKNGVPREAEVVTGLSDGENTEIMSGLQAGDEIVVTNFAVQSAAKNTSGDSGGQDSMRQFMRATGGGPSR